MFGNGASRAVLSRRAVTKVVLPIAHTKRSGPAGETLLPGFSPRPQIILLGNAGAIL